METTKPISTEELKDVVDMYSNFHKLLKRNHTLTIAEFASMVKNKPFTEDRTVKLFQSMIRLGYIKRVNDSRKYPIYKTAANEIEPIHARAIINELRRIIKRHNNKQRNKPEVNQPIKTKKAPVVPMIPIKTGQSTRTKQILPKVERLRKTTHAESTNVVRVYIFGIPVFKIITNRC